MSGVLDWLLVGALHAEVLPVVWLLEQPQATERRLVVGQLGPLRIGVLRCGVGPGPAEARTRATLAAHDARRVVSFGTCGGLRDDLAIGDLITASRLLQDVAPERELVPLSGWRQLACSTVTAPVDTPAARTRLRDAGAGICEMEATAVARAAGDRPVSVLKVVSDLAGGAPDGAFTGPRVVGFARFSLRALRLTQAQLAPALIQAISADPGNQGLIQAVRD